MNVKILDRNYKLSSTMQDERYVREAAALIDSQARLFGKMYGHQDHQDLVAMVALSKVTELVKIQDNLKYKDNELITKLAEIDSVLEQSLHASQNSL